MEDWLATAAVEKRVFSCCVYESLRALLYSTDDLAERTAEDNHLAATNGVQLSSRVLSDTVVACIHTQISVFDGKEAPVQITIAS